MPERTVLNGLHAELGARFTPFAGFEMPVQYGSILEEHATAPGPDTWISPMCETSNRPAWLRVCRCSVRSPSRYCTGIS